MDFKFQLQLFGGGSSTTTQERNIPAQSGQEAALQNLLYNYSSGGLTGATNLQNQAYTAVGNTYNPDWSNLINNYNGTMSGVTSGYSDLANGVLPSTYAANRQAALNADLTGTVGNAISNLGRRGVLNSSVTGSEFNQIGQNAADTLAKNYSSDLTTQAGLLNSQASNAAGLLSNNAAGQQYSYYQPTQLYNYANNQYSPASSLFNTMYSGRMGTAGTTTTQSGGDNGTAQAVGSIGAALITCFASGTMIATPDGEKPIEKIVVGDKVIGMDGNVETVTFVNKPCKALILEIETEHGKTKTTPTQRFYTKSGIQWVLEIVEPIITRTGEAHIKDYHYRLPEYVYDFTTTGTNSFFANGLASEGWD